ncbi:MAG: nuclear transport factor 2 family protein [Dehalococcoidia bacterium]|nr:nuclear transport factor 2 family protein [Dehalococcoidia bacterium]
MADRLEIAKNYMALQGAGDVDGAVALLADDVTISNPMTGSTTGKDAAAAGMRNRPGGGAAPGITWREPVADGENVKIVGDGSPFGPVRILISFTGDDKIQKVDIGLGS